MFEAVISAESNCVEGRAVVAGISSDLHFTAVANSPAAMPHCNERQYIIAL